MGLHFTSFCFKSSFSYKVCSTGHHMERVIKQIEKKCSLVRDPLSTQPKIVSQATGPHYCFVTFFVKK